MANLNNVKLYVALESTPGTTVTPTSAVAIRDLPTLDKDLDRKQSDVILGNGMRSGEYTLASDVKGTISINPRVNAGHGKLLLAHLGLQNCYQIGAILRLRYTGTSASCKIATTASTITSAVGALGSEAADATFGTAGSLTLSSYATAGALQTYLNGLANYKCDLVTGATTASTTTPGPVVVAKTQAANKYVYLIFQSTTSGVYDHVFQPDLSVNERPSLSVQKEGFQDNFLYSGVYSNNLNLSGSLKGFLQESFDLIGMGETAGQPAISNVVMPSNSDMTFQGGGVGAFFFDKTQYNYVRNFSFKSTNTMITDGYGVSSIDRQYVQKGLFEVTGDFELKLDANSYTERSQVFTSNTFSMALQFQGGTLANSCNELMIMEMPSVAVDTFKYNNSSGVLFAKVGYRVFNVPTQYDSPLSIHIVNTDSAAYSG